MQKKYIYIGITWFTLCLFIGGGIRMSAQNVPSSNTTSKSETIEGLTLYPNPITDGKIFIETKGNSTKEIAIYNLVGRKVYATILTSKELTLPNSIKPGIYILNIREKNGGAASRKIVVK